jgi:sec-independent protein translocase protein TatC
MQFIVEPPLPQWRLFGHDLMVLKPIQLTLNFASPYSFFLTSMLVSFVAGLVLTSPWVVYHLWAFVAGGLLSQERRYVKLYGGVSLLLFLAGAACFYYVVYPVAVNFFYSFAQSFNDLQLQRFGSRVFITNMTPVDSYVNFVLMMALVFGLMFQTPLVVLFLGRSGIVDVRTFSKYRRHAILAIVIIAAVVTPTADAFSCLALAVPMWILYELGILMVRITMPRKPQGDA